MAIEVTNMNTAATGEELATALEAADVNAQVNAEVGGMEQGLQSVTGEAASNCDVLGSVNGLVGEATASVKDSYKAATEAVEGAIGTVMETIGGVVKGVKSALAATTAKINEFVGWIRQNASRIYGEVLAQVKAGMQTLINGMNTVFSAVKEAVNTAVGAISNIAKEMFNSIKNLVASECKTISTSVKNIGSGAGIDSTAASASLADNPSAFAEVNMANVGSALGAAQGSLVAAQGSLGGAQTEVGNISINASALDAIMAQQLPPPQTPPATP